MKSKTGIRRPVAVMHARRQARRRCPSEARGCVLDLCGWAGLADDHTVDGQTDPLGLVVLMKLYAIHTKLTVALPGCTPWGWR
jgi:hypothetical protein